MTKDKRILDRPELALGPNPFISELPPYLTARKMMKRLSHFPLEEDYEWKSLPPELREPLLNFWPQHFGVTSIAYSIATAVQKLIRAAMVQRNPVNLEEQRRTNLVAMAENYEAITNLPKLNAFGGLITGITGLGKTAMVKRALDLVAPRQVIEYGRSDEFGWIKLKQVVWLHVDQPSNGSRTGLLKRIFFALDEAAGTDYFKQYSKVTNLDALLTKVCGLLTIHRVALLIVDENQVRNFEDSPWASEFVLFYLNVMNLGVATLLIGNPLAFKHMNSFAQDLRRFTTGGRHELKPAKDENERWWKEDLSPRIHRFSVMDSCSIDPDARRAFEFKHTAGIPGLLQVLNIESQRIAIERAGGAPRVELKLEHLEAALASPFYKDAAEIARQVHPENAATRTMIDIPPEERESNEKMSLSKLPDGVTMETLKRLVSRYHASQSRQFKKFQNRLQVIGDLTPEELKLLGLSTELQRSAEEAQEAIEHKTDNKRRAPRKIPK